MKVLFMLNGLTHYFNLITSQINNQPGVEIVYVYSLNKSAAMGEGVYETQEGVNFRLIQLEEKIDNKIGTLYYNGLDILLKELKPDIIMLAETHIKSVMYFEEIKAIINQQNIKIVLKSIPFQIKKYNDLIEDYKIQVKNLPPPPFNSVPYFPRRLLKVLKVDLLYKKIFINNKSLKSKMKFLNLQRAIYNFPDAHVNYIEEAYSIFGSYGVAKEKIFITYNSPDTDFYFGVKAKIEKEPFILPANNFRIIHLSRLVEWKRVDMLVTAVANLKMKYPGMELLVIGDGPEKEKLMQQALSLNVQDSIQFLGGVYDPEVLGKYLIASSIYILAGMGGLSINDAMIFGLPVICSKCDGTEKYLVKENYNGLYFENGNQQSLEDKISQLFNDPALRHQMGKNSVQIIKDEINIHTVVEGYMKAFNYVLKKHSDD